MNVIKTRLVTYWFNIENETDRIGYDELVKHCESLGLKKFTSLSMRGEHERKFDKKIESLSGEMVELETNFIFSNQWNTSENSLNLRVFDWNEKIYPNKNIKSGYYLVPTDEMIAIRKDNTRCHYCGNMSKISECIDYVCPHCEQSGYLIDLTKNDGGFHWLKDS